MLILSLSECYESPQLNFMSMVESDLPGLICSLSGKYNSLPFTFGLHTLFSLVVFRFFFYDIMITLAMYVESIADIRATGKDWECPDGWRERDSCHVYKISRNQSLLKTSSP